MAAGVSVVGCRMWPRSSTGSGSAVWRQGGLVVGLFLVAQPVPGKTNKAWV